MLRRVSKVDVNCFEESPLKFQTFKVGEGLNSTYLIPKSLTNIICSSESASCSKGLSEVFCNFPASHLHVHLQNNAPIFTFFCNFPKL